MGYNHRLVWLTSLARFIGYPACVLTAALRLAGPKRLVDSSLLLGALYVISVPIFWGFRNTIRDVMRTREAKRLGARIVPKVKGKWPGNIDLLIKLVGSLQSGYVAEVWDELAKEYGNTFNMRLLWDDMIVTIDHDVIKYMLATGFNSFGKGPNQQARLESFLGDGIFNRDGELWKFHRAMTRPFFVRERISEFDLFDNYTRKLLARIGECADEGLPVDVQDLFGRLTIDAAGEFLFSCTTLNTLSLPLPIAYKAQIGLRGTAAPTSYGSFVSAFDEAQTVIPVRGRMGPYIWPVAEWKGDKARKHRRVVDEWVKPLVDSAIQRREEFLIGGGEKNKPAGDTFIDDLVSSTTDRTLITDELVNILLAARDTTASLLTFTVYLLTQHPNVLHTLREEILEHVGPDAAPNYEQVKGMKYLRAILNETLRLFPSVPINERATLTDCSIPTTSGRFYIPSNTPVFYSPLLMQRRQDLWGPDAWEFDPARWLDGRNEGFIKDPMRFVPFNAGPRICLGQQFAYNEASFVLVCLFQKFSELTLAMDAAPEGSLPPPEWQGQSGRKGFERVWVKNAITLYSKAAECCVSSQPRSLYSSFRRTGLLELLELSNMHGLKTPTLFGLRTSRPASPAPKTSPPHVPPLVPMGAITPLDLSTPASPIEGPKDTMPRRPLAKLHLPSAFRRASPSPAPTPAPTGSNYLDALALRISEAAGKAIAPTPAHNSDGLLLHGRRPLPPGRGKLLGQVIQSEIHNAQQGGQDLLRASLRTLHRPLNVLLANVSTLLAPLVVSAPTNVLVPGNPWAQLGASQAHAIGLATLVAELLESLDSLPTDCAKVGGEGLRSIKQGLEGVISRVVQPVLNAVRTDLYALVDALEAGPLLGKKDNPLVGPIGIAIKVLARVASVPGPVAGGAIAACEIGVVWRAMVALAHRKIEPRLQSLSTKSSGPLKSSPPIKPKSTIPKRLTPPNTPPPTRFLLPTSRPPSPPSAISPAVQLANDAKTMLGMLDPMPRPGGDDAKEAVGEAFEAFKRFVDVLGVLAQPGFDTTALIRLVDGLVASPSKPVSASSPPKPPSTSSPTKPPTPSDPDDQEDELPALLILPTLLHGTSVASILGIDEAAYKERCLSGFGRAEASEDVVLRAVLARLDEDEMEGKEGVPEWVKAWMRDRADG